MNIEFGWPVAIALALLLLLAFVAHTVARYGLQKDVLLAGARAIVQLSVVALVITAVVKSLWLSFLLVAAMFLLGVVVTTRRVEALRAWTWAAVAMACGVVPVLVVVLGSGAVPLEGIAVIPIAGIIVGNAMTAHTLLGRRAFAALREEHGQYEATLALGMSPGQSVQEIVHRRAPEALFADLDKVKSVGMVTLPGAFIGVMLGGGSPVQAASAQALVLFGIMVAQVITVRVAEGLISSRKLLPADLRVALID